MLKQIISDLEAYAEKASTDLIESKIQEAIDILRTINDVERGERAQEEQKTVLIAEDDPTNQLAIDLLLKRNNYNTLSVVNGKEAEEIILQNKCDIALVDIQLPVQDGLQTIRNVREKGSKCIIIVMTAFTEDVAKSKAFTYGADYFLQKPLNYRNLFQLLWNINQKEEELDL